MPRDTTDLYRNRSRKRRLVDRMFVSVIIAAGIAAAVVATKGWWGEWFE